MAGLSEITKTAGKLISVAAVTDLPWHLGAKTTERLRVIVVEPRRPLTGELMAQTSARHRPAHYSVFGRERRDS